MDRAPRHHFGIEMAAGAGIDLHDRCAGLAHALAVIGGRLIALDHIERRHTRKIAHGAFEQRRLAGTGRADQIERQDLPPGKPGPVLRRRRVIFRENPALHIENIDPGSHLHMLADVPMRSVVMVNVVVRLAVRVAVRV